MDPVAEWPAILSFRVRVESMPHDPLPQGCGSGAPMDGFTACHEACSPPSLTIETIQSR